MRKEIRRNMGWLLGCAIVLLVASLQASAATVLYLDRPNSQVNTRQQVETAAHFYGLEVDSRSLDSRGDTLVALRALSNAKIVAVVINADALAVLDKNEVFKLTRSGQKKISILIAGVNAHSDFSLLKLWSSGAVLGSESLTIPSGAWYEVKHSDDVTRQLGGNRLPLNQRQTDTLIVEGAQRLMEAKSESTALPVFVRSGRGTSEVFFSSETRAFNIPVTPDPYRQQAIFASIASPMMFLRYAGEERAWHSPGNYANFTIDDLWLRKPYGHVDFEGLLQHAQLHNFHTTVAFIPWNYDRSQPEIVSLFQQNADRLSICVHGNNHVHQEFGPFAKHPLEAQERNIQQALARMNRFRQLTNISYDPVMVFPHSISPKETLAALKRANYLATANSLNVPSDASTPPDVDFALRSASLKFANFPSLRRYSTESEISTTQMAIDAFLGNPMLFYAHESFFATGINAFDPFADTVNRLQPGMQWRGLGDIVQHLYLEKLGDDGHFDIRAYSSSIRLQNNHERAANFLVEKDEDFSLPLAVFVNGRQYPFQREGTRLRIQLSMAKGDSKLVEVKYGNGTDPVGVSSSMGSPVVAAVRLLSDFRDNVISNSSLGRKFIRSYADNGSKWNRRIAALILSLGVLIVGLYMHQIRKIPVTRRAS